MLLLRLTQSDWHSYMASDLMCLGTVYWLTSCGCVQFKNAFWVLSNVVSTLIWYGTKWSDKLPDFGVQSFFSLQEVRTTHFISTTRGCPRHCWHSSLTLWRVCWIKTRKRMTPTSLSVPYAGELCLTGWVWELCQSDQWGFMSDILFICLCYGYASRNGCKRNIFWQQMPLLWP